MKKQIKTLAKMIVISALTLSCSKDDKGTQCGVITFLGSEDNCPTGFNITVDDGTTIMSRCVEESALNGLKIGDNYCLFD